MIRGGAGGCRRPFLLGAGFWPRGRYFHFGRKLSLTVTPANAFVPSVRRKLLYRHSGEGRNPFCSSSFPRKRKPSDFASAASHRRSVRPGLGSARILPATARPIPHLLAATRSNPGRAKRSSPRRRSSRNERSDVLLCSSPLGPSVKRRRSDGQGRVLRTRGAPGMARIWRQGRMPCRQTRPTAANRPLRGRRFTEGAFLWLAVSRLKCNTLNRGLHGSELHASER